MLKILMKKRELDCLNKDLEAIREKQAEFEKREEELKKDIQEASTDEERTAVEAAVDEFDKEKDETAVAERELVDKIEGIEKEIEETEAKVEEAKAEEKNEEVKEERKAETKMETREKVNEMDLRSVIKDENVQVLLSKVRTAIKEKRAIEGGSVIIPEVMLGLLRENIMDYSKLYKHVNVRQVSGNGREVIMGTIPEAVWTDCCGNINDLSLVFNDAEVGCWKVGGYFDVCNATLEDNDVNLAQELITVLGQAIGMALDKAIVFGLGTRMPKGIFTRLAETSEPADYPETARTWVDLHETNIKTIAADVKGLDLFAAFLADSAAAKGKYSRGEKVWIMNETTYTALVAAAMSINAAGAVVSGVNGTMPVIGGIIEVLDFMPDNVVIGGYPDLYLLAERAGTRIEQSEHVMFLNDRTVFRGTARYDGQPAIGEGFVAVGINGVTPSAESITFAPDDANADVSE